MTPHSMILRGVSIFYTKFLISQRKQNQNILTHWSVAQEGSNFEKKCRSKISLDCPVSKDNSLTSTSCGTPLTFSLAVTTSRDGVTVKKCGNIGNKARWTLNQRWVWFGSSGQRDTTIEDGLRQKRGQRSSLLFGGSS